MMNMLLALLNILHPDQGYADKYVVISMGYAVGMAYAL